MRPSSIPLAEETRKTHVRMLQNTFAHVFPSRSAFLTSTHPTQATGITGSHCTVNMVVWSYTAIAHCKPMQEQRGSSCRDAKPFGVTNMGVQIPRLTSLYRSFLLCLVTECLSHCLQSCRTRDQSCQIRSPRVEVIPLQSSSALAHAVLESHIG